MDGLSRRTRAGRRRTRGAAALAAAGALIALGLPSAPAHAAIVPEYDADAVAAAIIDDPTTLDTAATGWQELATPVPSPLPAPEDPPDPFPAAVSEVLLGGFPTAPASFAILATGDVGSVDKPNDGPGTSASFDLGVPDDEGLPRSDNGSLHGNTDNDATVLRMGVDVPAGANCVSLDYRFLSEEFPEFVNHDFNDAFIAEIDALTWTTSDNAITHAGDFATAPNGAPVSIDGVGGVAATAEEAIGTTFDGATGRVTTKSSITPGAHVIYLSIFDQGDSIYDSAVMLDRLAFFTEAASTCKPPEVPVIAPPPPPPPASTPPPPPLPPNDFSAPGASVTFRNGSATVTVQVPGPGTVSASQASGPAAARLAVASKKKKLIKPANAVATKAGAVKLKIAPTKAGKKVLRKKKQLKVNLAITFTPTGGLSKTEVSAIVIKVKRKHKHR